MPQEDYNQPQLMVAEIELCVWMSYLGGILEALSVGKSVDGIH
jgi:hypothetical protein